MRLRAEKPALTCPSFSASSAFHWSMVADSRLQPCFSERGGGWTAFVVFVVRLADDKRLRREVVLVFRIGELHDESITAALPGGRRSSARRERKVAAFVTQRVPARRLVTVPRGRLPLALESSEVLLGDVFLHLCHVCVREGAEVATPETHFSSRGVALADSDGVTCREKGEKDGNDVEAGTRRKPTLCSPPTWHCGGAKCSSDRSHVYLSLRDHASARAHAQRSKSGDERKQLIGPASANGLGANKVQAAGTGSITTGTSSRVQAAQLVQRRHGLKQELGGGGKVTRGSMTLWQPQKVGDNVKQKIKRLFFQHRDSTQHTSYSSNSGTLSVSHYKTIDCGHLIHIRTNDPGDSS